MVAYAVVVRANRLCLRAAGAGNPYLLTLIGTGEDAAATGDLDILDNLTIQGGGSAGTIIDANNIDRAIHILPGVSLTMSDVTIQNGLAPRRHTRIGGTHAPLRRGLPEPDRHPD